MLASENVVTLTLISNIKNKPLVLAVLEALIFPYRKKKKKSPENSKPIKKRKEKKKHLSKSDGKILRVKDFLWVIKYFFFSCRNPCDLIHYWQCEAKAM